MKYCMILLLLIVFVISAVLTSSSQATESDGVFYSKNGTNLAVLRVHDEVDIVFAYGFRSSDKFDGYVYYNIAEDDKKIHGSANFTAGELPQTFDFSYTPKKTGVFFFTRGSMSHSGDFHGEQSMSFIVVEEFSKAMKFNGKCKNAFPEFTLVIKPDFSTGACVTMDTAKNLKGRGWH